MTIESTPATLQITCVAIGCISQSLLFQSPLILFGPVKKFAVL